LPYIDCDVNACMDKMISSFNGLSELLFKREDGVSELIKRYDDLIINLAAICSHDGGGIMNYADLEILLGRYHSDNDNAVDTYKEILKHLVVGYHAKLLFPDKFSLFYCYQSNFIARANLITRISPGSIPSRPKLPDVFGFHGADQSECELINKLSYELIN